MLDIKIILINLNLNKKKKMKKIINLWTSRGWLNSCSSNSNRKRIQVRNNLKMFLQIFNKKFKLNKKY
jgi:hypothetical protein